MLEIEKQIWLEIFELYKNMPFLWNKKNLYYYNADVRRSGFKAILEKYQLIDKNANADCVRNKMFSMTVAYKRELKKAKACKGSNKKYVPDIWFFDYLHFLEGNDEPFLKRRYNFEKFNEYLQDTQEPSTDQMDNNSISPDKNKKSAKDSKGKEWEVLGKSIALQLKDLNTHQLIIAQKLISQTISYAKSGELREDSFISNQCDVPTFSSQDQSDNPSPEYEFSSSMPSTSSSEYEIHSPPTENQIETLSPVSQDLLQLPANMDDFFTPFQPTNQAGSCTSYNNMLMSPGLKEAKETLEEFLTFKPKPMQTDK